MGNHYFVSAWVDGVTDKLVDRPLLAVVEAKKQDFVGAMLGGTDSVPKAECG